MAAVNAPLTLVAGLGLRATARADHLQALWQQALAHGIQAVAGARRQAQAGLAALAARQRRQRLHLRAGCGQVGLVPQVDDGNVRRNAVGQRVRNLQIVGPVAGLAHAREVVQKQHGVGGGDLVPGAGNADALHLVLAVAQAGGVDHVQRHAVDLDGLLHLVARGAGDRGDDGQLGPGQRVQQRAFAGIGLAGDHHLDAFAQQRALLGAGQHLAQLVAQRVQLAIGIGLLQEVDLFLGEVQRGLDQHTQVDQGFAQLADLAREVARQRAAGAARRRLGAGVDQVGNRLGLGQVDLVVEEGALGELTGLGQAQAGQDRGAVGPRRLRGLQAARQQQLQHHGAAVGLQLQHVLAGVAVRAGEVQRQAMVDGRALGVLEGQVAGLARLQVLAQQVAHQGADGLAGDTHNADGPAPGGGGDGDDGIGMAGKHGVTSSVGAVPMIARGTQNRLSKQEHTALGTQRLRSQSAAKRSPGGRSALLF
ncbi:hypothetical protein MA05_01965 [Comamonas aquatica]|nr:hypothetical protein MA05_01965 [Comamonas aquatica]